LIDYNIHIFSSTPEKYWGYKKQFLKKLQKQNELK